MLPAELNGLAHGPLDARFDPSYDVIVAIEMRNEHARFDADRRFRIQSSHERRDV